MMDKGIIILGAGGHAKVIADILIKRNESLIGFLDDNIPIGTKVLSDYSVIGRIDDCINFDDSYFIIGIGNNKIRKTIAENFTLNWHTAIHPTAVIASGIKIGEGSVIMANSVINIDTKIGCHAIVNTASIVEHDDIIGDYVHISPNATLGGTVSVGEGSHIGIGAVVKNNINICNNCVIGAGGVVVKDLKKEGTYVGVPAREMK